MCQMLGAESGELQISISLIINTSAATVGAMITLKLTEMDNANLCVIAPIEVRKWMEEKMLNGLIDTLIWVFVIALFALGCLAVFTVICVGVFDCLRTAWNMCGNIWNLLYNFGHEI